MTYVCSNRVLRTFFLSTRGLPVSSSSFSFRHLGPFEDGVTSWTRDISHGDPIRDGYDETLTMDSNNPNSFPRVVIRRLEGATTSCPIDSVS